MKNSYPILFQANKMSVRGITILACWVFLLGIVSCNKPVTITEFMKKVTGEGDFKSKYEDETYLVTCFYRPVEYMALVEINGLLESGNKEQIRKEFDKAAGSFANVAYFTLTLGLKNGNNVIVNAAPNRGDYAYLQQYLENQVINDLYIKTDRDIEIKPVIHNYQQSYGSSPNAVLLIGFPREQLAASFDNNFALVYKDKIFGLNKDIELPFKASGMTGKKFDLIF